MANNVARTVLAMAVLAAVGASGFAQSDPIDRVKALAAIADQKAEAHIKEVLADVDKFAKASPTTAVKRLKEARLGLDRSVEITSEKRVELVKIIDAKIAVIEGRTPVTLDPKAAQRKEAEAKSFEKYLAEAKEIKEAVAEIEKLYAANKTIEARVKADALAKKYPTNPTALVLTGQGLVQDRIAEAKYLSKEMNDRFVYALNDVQRSALPPKGDIEFPANWKEITERRRRMNEVKLSPEEESILKALESKVPKELRDAPFEETVQQLSNLIDKPIYLDKKSLEDAGLDMRRPVTLLGGVTARTALRAILQSQGLTYVIKDKVIQVVSLPQARETLVTKVYYLGSDVVGTGPFGGSVTWGPFVDFQQTERNAQVIVDTITKSIDPLNWQSANNPNGLSSITFHYPSMSLIVRAPAEVHASLGRSLAGR
jgi:hypothetical protein